jgi:hypothetical protein
MLSSQCFSTNQISLLQIFALLLQIFALLLRIFALLLQIFALLFGIKCTETNQAQSCNISMYFIKLVMISEIRRAWTTCLCCWGGAFGPVGTKFMT